MLTLYIDCPNGEREQITVSIEDNRRVNDLCQDARLGAHSTVTVTNHDTGEQISLRAAQCNLGCWCAVERITAA